LLAAHVRALVPDNLKSGVKRALYRQVAKADLIVIEDFGIAPLADETVRDSRWRSSRTATTGARPSFPASYLWIDGTPTSAIAPSPTPCSIGSRITAIASCSRATRKHRGSALKSASPTTHAAAHLFEFPGLGFIP